MDTGGAYESQDPMEVLGSEAMFTVSPFEVIHYSKMQFNPVRDYSLLQNTIQPC